jgi:drug/metabolite transporter (DMT)-like permease
MAFLGNRPSARVIAGLVVGVVAVVVLVGWSPLEPTMTTILAVAAGLGAPASYALAGNFVRAKMRDVEPTELATGMVTAGALLALPVALLSGAPRTPNLEGIVSLVGVGVLSTALAWPVFFRVLRRTTATAASTVTFIVPAFALAFAAIVLGEAVGPELVVGFALILVSLSLVLGIVPDVRMPLSARAARIAGAFGRA